MLFELLTKRNNRSYNLKLAKFFGVYSAVFISLLLDTKEESELLNKTVEKFFIMSRQQIYDLTGLEDSKQLDVENVLVETGLLEIKPVKNSSEKFYYGINEELLMNILMAKDTESAEKLITKTGDTKKLIKQERVEKISKRANYILNLKKGLKESDPVVRDLLNTWIDTVYENPKGFLAPTTIAACLKTLEEYSGGKQKVKKEVIDIAIKSQHRNLDWSIEQHQKQVKSKSAIKFSDKVSASEIDNNIKEILKGEVNGF